MKTTRIYLFVVIALLFAPAMLAQQPNTLYFLENSPMRHTINPAFQPLSKVYVLLPALGQINIAAGNNAVTMEDLIFTDPTTGKTITALHPNAEGKLWNELPNILNINADVRLNLLSFGRRVAKNKGYFHVNVAERIHAGIGLPKSTFGPLLGQSLNDINLNTVNASAIVFTEAAIGYSHNINEQWALGFKAKFLLGQAYARAYFNELCLTSTEQQTALHGDGSLQVGGILNAEMLDALLNGTDLPENTLSVDNILNSILAGMGGAIDLGVTYKPLKQLQISAAVTDLGLIHWKNGGTAAIQMDTTFNGLGNIQSEDYVDSNGEFQSDAMIQDITDNLVSYLDALHLRETVAKPINQMLTANLNVGVDANFWKNRVGVGVYSNTRFYNMLEKVHVTEEVTLGAAFRPANWFNLALSYSFMNGHWSNAGVGLSLAPYDGIMLTVLADYVPCTFVNYATDTMVIPLPYKTSQFNLSLGLAIVVGTNPKKNNK